MCNSHDVHYLLFMQHWVAPVAYMYAILHVQKNILHGYQSSKLISGVTVSKQTLHILKVPTVFYTKISWFLPTLLQATARILKQDKDTSSQNL